MKLKWKCFFSNVGKSVSFNPPKNDGTNCCTFLALKICESWSFQNITAKQDWGNFNKKMETILKDFPSKINSYRDVGKHYDVTESIKILSKNALMKDVQVKKLTKCTNTFSSEGYEDVRSAMNQMVGIGVMVCPPYTFVVGKFFGELFIIDTNVIPNHFGGTENGVVILVSSMMHFLQWLLRHLESSGVKTGSHHEIFQIYFPPNNTAQAEDNTTIHVDTHQELPIDTYEETTVENETYFSFNEQEKNKTSDWSQVELKYWENTISHM